MSVQSIHQVAEKVALISDAASPIGRAVAIQLALNGSYVVGLFQEEGGNLEELIELGTLAHAVKADPSSSAGAAAAATEVDRLFHLINVNSGKKNERNVGFREPHPCGMIGIELGRHNRGRAAVTARANCSFVTFSRDASTRRNRYQ